MGTNELPPELLNTVHCMDCLEFMKGLPDGCIDLVLTDPPYGIGIKGKVGGEKLAKVRDYGNFNNWDNIIPSKDVFQEIKRVSKNAIIFGGNYFIENLENSPCRIVRDKNNSGNFADCELARTNFDTAVRLYKYTWNGMLQEDMKNKEFREHPTQKPVALFRRILENYSEQGMTILDCFAGSGTTGVACKELGRNYILVEKEPKYCDIIHKRLQNTTVSLFHS